MKNWIQWLWIYSFLFFGASVSMHSSQEHTYLFFQNIGCIKYTIKKNNLYQIVSSFIVFSVKDNTTKNSAIWMMKSNVVFLNIEKSYDFFIPIIEIIAKPDSFH